MPVEVGGDHGKSVGEDRLSDVGAGIDDTRKGRNVSVFLEALGNVGDEHQIDPVHTARDQRQTDCGDGGVCPSVKQKEGEGGKHGNAEHYGAAYDLIFEKFAIQRSADREAENTENSGEDTRKDRGFVADTVVFCQIRRHPRCHAVTQHSLKDDAENNKYQGEDRCLGNGKTCASGFCGRLNLVGGRKFRADPFAGKKPKQRDAQTDGGGYDEHALPASRQSDNERSDQIDGNGGKGGAPRNPNHRISVHSIVAVGDEDPYDGRPHHCLRKSVDAPSNCHGGDRGGEEGEDQIDCRGNAQTA